MKTTENHKTKISDIEEIPINDFSRFTDLLKKGRYGLGVNLSYMNRIKDIKGMLKLSDYFLIRLTLNLVYLYILTIVIGAIIVSNYYLLIGIPIFYIFKNSGIIDIWIVVLISVVLFIIITIFNLNSISLYAILSGIYLTYVSSKIAFLTFINKMKEKSLKTENNFCLLFQMNLITITDVRKNEVYSIHENNKNT